MTNLVPKICFAVACLLLVVAGERLGAEVVSFEVASRQPYAESRVFGERGAYEQVRGKIHFAVDPENEANGRIVDLELAPRNAEGRVEFSADFEFLAPSDLAKANGAALYEVNNRGNRTCLGQFNGGADDFLMRQGFVIVWSGWIAETLPGGDRLRLNAPTASERGEPIRGIVRAEITPNGPAERLNIAQWANQGSYPPTERGLADATLTWRLREKDPRVAIPRSQWRLEQTSVVADGQRGQLPLIEMVLAGGFQPGYIYELIYEAEGPLVQGAGLAGIRDLVSCLKYDRSERNPLRRPDGSSAVKYAYGFGTSQSGRCLRMFLYDGFNADEAGRQVFDGLMPHVAGAGLGFFNHRFASPTRHNSQHDNHLYPADVFPFAYGDEQDPFSGRTDGILRRAQASKTAPKVMHTQSSSEYWHRSGSLVHTDPLGLRDAEIPPEVRIYTFGGCQHGPGSGVAGPRGSGQLPGCPSDYRPLLRALLMAMDSWVREGREPPPSAFPKLSDQTLVGWREPESGWRPLAGVRYPEVIQQPEFLDRGPEFFQRRRTSIEPPRSLGHYVVRIPAYGDDDNERGALRLPSVAVPVGSFLSWNLRHLSIGGENELLSLSGGYVPFAKTAQERQAAGDPREAISERYASYADYRERFMAAAGKLAAEGYLLAEDLPRLEAAAKANEPLFEPFPGQRSQWNGFDRYDFEVDGKPVLVVAPKHAAPGKPWVWHGEFFGHKPAPDVALLHRGFHVVSMSVPDMLGSPRAVEHWNVFYRELTEKHGFAKKAALVGLSRGGLYAYNWAAANPDKTACIYADAAVCDFKSWPGGKGTGKGSPRDWQLVLDRYGFEDDAEALAYKGNPVDRLAPLAGAGVPLLHVYGDADDVVPWEENTGLVAERYRKLGGTITLIAKPGVGHHPHGLEDSAPIVDFIALNAAASAAGYRILDLAGWRVAVNEGLLKQDEAATQRAIELLQAQLDDLIRILPAGVVTRLQAVPLWMSPAPSGQPYGAEYHPSADWLGEHGRNPAMAKGVEFTNIPIFAQEIVRMPMMTLHELAHAYHDRVLGFEHAEIEAAYRRAVESKSYEAV
ncbi:MAG TPA: alpha/beta hydrolase domain-containing protein, partial [Pirellulales bacterium]|nr:alpha/beta hydrolase domain-containing protein [Pirellulales bacterium]